MILLQNHLERLSGNNSPKKYPINRMINDSCFKNEINPYKVEDNGKYVYLIKYQSG